ncbi:MAG: hypothetical protein C0423_03935 [Methylibium sp.]|nr:hypothetical protein [Methylibium sp.]
MRCGCRARPRCRPSRPGSASSTGIWAGWAASSPARSKPSLQSRLFALLRPMRSALGRLLLPLLIPAPWQALLLMHSPAPYRLLHVDALKALAAQTIVLHHLAAYGPVAEAVQSLWPALIEFLYEYGRMAVQVFLVVGGFLSARGLLPDGHTLRGDPPALLWRRYQRLMLPFMAAVLLTLACSLLVERWLPELVPASVSAAQLAAHGLLLHGVMGVESLTVGAWYVAIDLQLFALMLGLLWFTQGRPAARFIGPLLLLALLAASLFWFNLDAGHDNWGWYFFGFFADLREMSGGPRSSLLPCWYQAARPQEGDHGPRPSYFPAGRLGRV